MALKEIKNIEVPPADEERTIQLWMSFGWELKNNQRVKTQDVQRFTGQDSDGTEHYQTTRGVDFVRLTFERNPEIKNYAELKALQEEYNNPLPVFHATPPGNKPKKPGVFGIVISLFFGSLFLALGIIGIVGLLFDSSANAKATYLGIAIPFTIIGTPLFWLGIRGIKRRKSFSSRLKFWETTNEAYQTQHSTEEKAISEAKKKRADALEKAKSLV